MILINELKLLEIKWKQLWAIVFCFCDQMVIKDHFQTQSKAFKIKKAEIKMPKK